jgi:hypothetical protein
LVEPADDGLPISMFSPAIEIAAENKVTTKSGAIETMRRIRVTRCLEDGVTNEQMFMFWSCGEQLEVYSEACDNFKN